VIQRHALDVVAGFVHLEIRPPGRVDVVPKRTRRTAWTSNAAGIQTFGLSSYLCWLDPVRARSSVSSRSLSPRGAEVRTTPSLAEMAFRRPDRPGEHLLLVRSGSPWGQDLHVWTEGSAWPSTTFDPYSEDGCRNELDGGDKSCWAKRSDPFQDPHR